MNLRNSYTNKEFPAGTEIDLEYASGKYIINWRIPDSYGTLESYRSYKPEEIDALVYLDLKNMDAQSKEKLKTFEKIIKKPVVSFFGSPEIKESITANLVNKIDRALSFATKDNTEVSCAKAINPRDVFSSYYAKLRIRKDKIAESEDVVNCLAEVIKQKLYSPNIELAQNNKNVNRRKSQEITMSLHEPKGSPFRDFLHKKFNLPSSYSAANVSELWAETITKAAMNLNSIDKQLKNVLMQVLTMK